MRSAVMLLALLALAGRVAGAADARPPSTTPRAEDVARGVVSPGDEKLDARLRALMAPAASVPATASALVPQPLEAVQGSRVHVFVRLESAAAADVLQLAQTGLTVDRVSADHGLVRGWVGTLDLRRIARLGNVRSVTLVRRALVRVGSVTSEGDAAARAPQARATGFDGTGVTVGVISDGVDHIAASRVTGDLKAGTGVPGGFGCAAGQGDEGTAILEIVQDLAPGASLLFSEGASDKLAFVDSISCLRNAGAKVIVDDLGFFDEPFFEDGLVAEAVRAAVQAGVSYHSSAGNEAQGHYGGAFHGVTDPVSGALYHDFAPGAATDTFNRIDLTPGQILQCVLQWNDRFDASGNDYDLELWDVGGSTPVLVDASTNVQSGTQSPLEVTAPVKNTGATTAHAGVRIRRASGADRQLSLFCFGGSVPQFSTPAGSIFGQPALTEVVTVGAIDIHDTGLNDVEAFSSQGPVSIFFPASETRDKPDLAGFDGVATSVCPSAAVCFNPFFGTSAAAPHSAAVAALLLSRNSCLTPAQVQQTMRSGAVDILAAGFDEISGAGRLDALGTMTQPGPCDDGNPCTVDTCTPQTGCQHTVLSNGTSCADADLCDGTETCQGGTCVPGTPLVCDDGSVCTTDSCNPATGCVFTTTCGDGNPCTLDTCDPQVGCQSTPVADGTPCLDDDVCNGGETCNAGVCTAGAPLVCTGGAACTTSACDAKAGCTFPPVEGFPGVGCLCGAGLTADSCSGTATPRAVANRFAHACDLVSRASRAKRPRRTRQLIMQAVRVLAKATRGAERATKRAVLSSECASALTAILDDTQARATRIADGL